MRHWIACLSVVAIATGVPASERINHEGRILGPIRSVTQPTLFNTPEADTIVSTLQVFPRDNAWNEDISRRPLLSNSAAVIAQISSDLATNRQTLRMFEEMNFVLVPDSQPLVPIDFFEYPEESEPSPYPIPGNLPVESWPTQTEGQSLADWQRDIYDWGGDRHAVIAQPGTGKLWETWQTKFEVNDGPSRWIAANGAVFNLNTNKLRPLGWTSADAAGLSMFAGLVRYDECQRGMVEHAIRLVVKRTRRAYVYPATHYASTNTEANLPAMGQRLRLRADYPIPVNWRTEEKAIALALKKYGALVADNGNFFSVSVVPDDRWVDGVFSRLSTLVLTNFEVIQTTGPNEGPRSPGAPLVSVGPNRVASVGTPISLQAAVIYTNAAPLTMAWKRYSGPAPIVFGSPSAANSTARFDVPGEYVVIFSASNGVHAAAFDALHVTAVNGILLSGKVSGTNLNLEWVGAPGTYEIEASLTVSLPQWNSLGSTNGLSFSASIGPVARYFRVKKTAP
jgi:hypothetical protein